ncbi:hypothetical protein OG539_21990 [Actinacidiphila glaucinigra]|uniref:hypothetical protein n=1 Tax=Actinacidiphila glaucinigra TaxID=235986 RepID=UPI002DDB6961|nr:hypothetical protein [Actinacidiphila glaucinigra]WSD61171.1 hypothetical protein OIE69_20790 [Actinacidiphila glaucinigra]
MAHIRIASAFWPVAAAAGVLVLAGCSQGDGGSAAPAAAAGPGDRAPSSKAAANGELAVPEGADEGTRQIYVSENATAACMRKKGFTYTPHVSGVGAAEIPVDGQDYELAKKYREKFGFGFFAPAVYPDDPTVAGSKAHEAQDTNPDRAYLDALSPAQRKAYDKAMGTAKQLASGKKVMLPGCVKEGIEKGYGPEKSQAQLDRERAENEEQDRAAKQALNGDPQLISLAQQFASCLRDEGIAVTTTQPTAIGDMVKFATVSLTPSSGVQNMDEEEGRAKLTQEIGIALKDLECGKNFRAAYFPKLAKHPFSGMTG